MSKGKVVFYDNEPHYTTLFQTLMEESGFEIALYNNIDVLRSSLSDNNFMLDVKALIFDLAKDAQEASDMKDFAIIEDIKKNFSNYRIPIFIHSAFASVITEFDDYGTIWKFDKTGTSLEDISKIIDKLDDSGFISAFSPGGIIEQTLFSELHKNFTQQFRKDEIVNIIDSIKQSNPENYKDRVVGVFKRIAIRSLMADLLAPIVDKGETVNPIEHYYRRTNTVLFWTGDIWKKKGADEFYMILSPRCDIALDKLENLLVCLIEPILSNEIPTKKDSRIKKLEDFLRDNVLGKSFRYLPKSPVFIGGKINLSKHETVPKSSFKDSFTYVATLSDDLTNEILGKFAYYFLRTGINTISASEFDSYLELLKEIPEDEKQ